jgi:hypothetical protein
VRQRVQRARRQQRHCILEFSGGSTAIGATAELGQSIAPARGTTFSLSVLANLAKQAFTCAWHSQLARSSCSWLTICM